MGLAEAQEALAKLAIDRALRDRIFTDPAAACAELGLVAEDIVELQRIQRQPLEQFAESLRRKRRDQVRRTLPLTVSALGEHYPDLFERYLEASPPRGCKPGLDDAEGFIKSLERLGERLEPRWAAELGRYELAWRLAALAGRFPVIRIFRYPVARLFTRKNHGEQLAPWPTLACWWRPAPRAKIRHIVLSVPVIWRPSPKAVANEFTA